MADRTDYILERLDEVGFLNVNDLADELDVSSATIRRDFSSLEEEGKLRRVAGGAIKLSDEALETLDTDTDVGHKMTVNAEAKRRVCELAASVVQDGDCVYIDGGSSSVYLFKLLQNRHITIVTTNLLLSSHLELPVTASIIIVGGMYIAEHALTFNSTAYAQMQGYNFNHSFVTCAGADVARGLAYCTEAETRNLKQLVCRQSKHSHLLVDCSKLGKIGFCNLGRLDSFDTVFCDKPLDNEDYPTNFRFCV